jgi:hypothetical protein
LKSKAGQFLVVKTHDPCNALRFANDTTAIFSTVSHHPGFNFTEFAYVQNVSMLKENLMSAYMVVWKYQSIFALTDSEMVAVAAYFELWDILRLCCGKQMSKHWRHWLTTYETTNSRHAAAVVNLCQQRNISQVETDLLLTSVAKQLRKSRNNDMVRPSTSEPLSGSYCELYKRGVKEKHLKFDEGHGR